MARITWGIIGRCFGANDILRNLNQYKIWIAKWLPGGELIYSNRCASVCWTIWKCRNKACFDKKHIKNLSEFIICACSFLTYWTGLYNEVTQERILDGVQQLLACAHKVLANSSKKLVSRCGYFLHPLMMRRTRTPPTEDVWEGIAKKSGLLWHIGLSIHLVQAS